MDPLNPQPYPLWDTFLKHCVQNILKNGINNNSLPNSVQDWLAGRILKILPEHFIKNLLSYLEGYIEENEFTFSFRENQSVLYKLLLGEVPDRKCESLTAGLKIENDEDEHEIENGIEIIEDNETNDDNCFTLNMSEARQALNLDLQVEENNNNNTMNDDKFNALLENLKSTINNTYTTTQHTTYPGSPNTHIPMAYKPVKERGRRHKSRKKRLETATCWPSKSKRSKMDGDGDGHDNGNEEDSEEDKSNKKENCIPFSDDLSNFSLLNANNSVFTNQLKGLPGYQTATEQNGHTDSSNPIHDPITPQIHNSTHKILYDHTKVIGPNPKGRWPESERTCKICEQTYSTREAFCTHMFQAHKQKVNKCRFCETRTVRCDHLLVHMRKKHPELLAAEKDMVKCPYCDLCFNKEPKHYLSQHISSIHKEESEARNKSENDLSWHINNILGDHSQSGTGGMDNNAEESRKLKT